MGVINKARQANPMKVPQARGVQLQPGGLNKRRDVIRGLDQISLIT